VVGNGNNGSENGSQIALFGMKRGNNMAPNSRSAEAATLWFVKNGEIHDEAFLLGIYVHRLDC
jgi:hypothetical protein